MAGRLLVGTKDGNTPLRLSGVAGVWRNEKADMDGGPDDLVIFMEDGGMVTIPAGHWDRALFLKDDPFTKEK